MFQSCFVILSSSSNFILLKTEPPFQVNIEGSISCGGGKILIGKRSSGINRDALESQMDAADALLEKAGSVAGSVAGKDMVAPGVAVGAAAGSTEGSVGSVASNNKEEKKEKFNDELVSPQDLSDSAPVAAKNSQNSRNNVGNDVKADKQGTKGIDKKAQEIKEAAPYKKDE